MIKILITQLNEINKKLAERYYKKELYSFAKCKYTANELCIILNYKTEIIVRLYKLGAITEDGYREYMLSEDPEFTPLILDCE